MNKLSVFCLALLVLAGCNQTEPPKAPAPPKLVARKFTQKEWQDLVLKSKEPVLVEFGATWCGPCKQMAPILDSLAQDFTVYKVDVDESRELAQAYGISGLPTMLVFKDGRVKTPFRGWTSEADLREALLVAKGK